MEKDIKSILSKLEFPDDAKVMQQIADQTLQVKTRMGLIRHKLVVLSGKGGVGKSMVTVNLALAFARQGFRVGILDVDLNGPCVPKMLSLKGQRFEFGGEGAIPPIGPLGIKVASMEFFLRQDSPVRWKGPMDLSPVWLGMMEMSVIREFLGDIVWGELDLLLADLPPGAAEELLASLGLRGELAPQAPGPGPRRPSRVLKTSVAEPCQARRAISGEAGKPRLRGSSSPC